ncbi:PucR family transcriptional regulator [Anaerosacchariphilus polymeriproducens]|uniref:PucR family transcriptional regulator n=1 Tax=Anaerosacchariphilus polymeriproducens TaxID=1812858 RepID=A0A371AXX3_9FIRM|nr:PucR family transcriptional regulator [Anaerosacchariphilus polymeriproducens]RDU24434.1 PucR family transcriptional regulator [Anaerosacchariphilus polymeriproducens]
MELEVEKVYKNSKKNYDMKLLAGKDGLKNHISWVHILESVSVNGYVKGNEFVFTTGIIFENKVGLLEFVKGLYNSHASGLAINIGPYIKEIPKDVIDYCNKQHFPLFTIPWNIYLVDITKDICSLIVKDKQLDFNASTIFKEILFSSVKSEKYRKELKEFGYDADSSYCTLSMTIVSGTPQITFNQSKFVKNNVIQILNRAYANHSVFVKNKTIIIILCDVNKQQLSEIINEIKKFFSTTYTLSIRVGVGKIIPQLNNLVESYESSRETLLLATKWKKQIINYEDIGIYKILLDGKKSELINIYQESIGALENIDEINKTDYVEFVKIYIKYNGSIRKLSDELYVHRNTINYKLKQIKKLIGYDLSKMEDLFKIMLALKIERIL